LLALPRASRLKAHNFTTPPGLALSATYRVLPSAVTAMPLGRVRLSMMRVSLPSGSMR
jgi:hypothetical protein